MKFKDIKSRIGWYLSSEKDETGFESSAYYLTRTLIPHLRRQIDVNFEFDFGEYDKRFINYEGALKNELTFNPDAVYFHREPDADFISQLNKVDFNGVAIFPTDLIARRVELHKGIRKYIINYPANFTETIEEQGGWCVITSNLIEDGYQFYKHFAKLEVFLDENNSENANRFCCQTYRDIIFGISHSKKILFSRHSAVRPIGPLLSLLIASDKEIYLGDYAEVRELPEGIINKIPVGSLGHSFLNDNCSLDQRSDFYDSFLKPETVAWEVIFALDLMPQNN